MNVYIKICEPGDQVSGNSHEKVNKMPEASD